MKQRLVLAALPLILFAFTLHAQVKLDYYLPKGTTYNPAVPTPEAFFGFQVGEWHLRPDQVDAYLYALASATDRFKIERIGKTYEERPLLLLTISSPDNLKNKFSSGARKSSDVFSPLNTRAMYAPSGNANPTVSKKINAIEKISVMVELKLFRFEQHEAQVKKQSETDDEQSGNHNKSV